MNILEYLKDTIKTNTRLSIESYAPYKLNPEKTIKEFENLNKRDWIEYDSNTKTAIISPGGMSNLKQSDDISDANLLAIIAVIFSGIATVLAISDSQLQPATKNWSEVGVSVILLVPIVKQAIKYMQK